jgi:hypothetical protein
MPAGPRIPLGRAGRHRERGHHNAVLMAHLGVLEDVVAVVPRVEPANAHLTPSGQLPRKSAVNRVRKLFPDARTEGLPKRPARSSDC